MAGHFPENVLEDILNRVDIVELISGYIPLKRAGRNFKALCPFHQEKTASFMVSPDRQIYHCFGCGVSGNAFKFLMQYERFEFPEAVELLAKKAGVTLPQLKEDSRATSLATQLFKINEIAVLFYEHNLNSSPAVSVQQYLLKRGLKPKTAALFKLGFAWDRWDGLLNHLRSKGVSLALMEKAGLVLPKEGGGYYDRFRNRIIFPIFDIKGRALGFGARVQDLTLPKYINSPETPIYIKGRNLYALNLAKDSIRDNDCAVVVEGYLDCITPYQEGLTNIVASMGTALTPEQARLLRRYTRNVVMVYDADAAGEMASMRTLDIFVEEEMDVRVVSLPQGFDPDSFVRRHGIDQFKEKIRLAEDLFDYKLRMLSSRYNRQKIEGKSTIASLMLDTIGRFKNAVLKSEYVKKLSGELDIREEALLEELGKRRSDKPREEALGNVAEKEISINPTEKLLLQMMLQESVFINRIKETLVPEDFQDERAARIVSLIFELDKQGKPVQPQHLINHLGDEGFTRVICELTLSPDAQEQDSERIIDDCTRRLKHERLQLEKRRLHEEIKALKPDEDDEQLRRLIEEFQNLARATSRQKKNLSQKE
jgi:DNA primase